MAKSQQGGKSKRRQSDGKKLLRARSRARCELRHLERAKIQDLAHRVNLQLIAAGELLPWEQACLERAREREALGLYQEWASIHKELATAQAELRSRFLAYIA